MPDASPVDVSAGEEARPPDAASADAASAEAGARLDGSDSIPLLDGNLLRDVMKADTDGSAAFEAGPDATTDGSGQMEASSDAAYPRLLSETGLFADMSTEALGPGVRAYQPQYVLWSDGATKRRWVYLPDAVIDTSRMDFWSYPEGTKVWKEFSVDGKRLETRLLHKRGPGPSDWVMIAYAWKEDRTDAVAVPDGVSDALATSHDIPPQDACAFCHGNMRDRLLGFTALQLSHNLPGVTLATLAEEGRLSDPPEVPLLLPGEDVARAALGYLHANCGDCHNPSSEVFRTVDLELWASAEALGSVPMTRAYRTAVNEPDPGSSVNRIVPGIPERSMVYVRMSVRGNGQMPPIATKTVDEVGLAAVADFIRSLAPVDGGIEPGDGASIDGAPSGNAASAADP